MAVVSLFDTKYANMHSKSLTFTNVQLKAVIFANVKPKAVKNCLDRLQNTTNLQNKNLKH